MKKCFALMVCLTLLCEAAYSGSLTFVNITNTPIFIGQVAGRNSPLSPNEDFAIGDILVPLGITVYPNPTTLPGAPSSASASGFFTTLTAQCSPTFIGIGSATFTLLPQLQPVAAGSDCNNGDSFDVNWNQGTAPDYNVVVLMW